MSDGKIGLILRSLNSCHRLSMAIWQPNYFATASCPVNDLDSGLLLGRTTPHGQDSVSTFVEGSLRPAPFSQIADEIYSAALRAAYSVRNMAPSLSKAGGAERIAVVSWLKRIGLPKVLVLTPFGNSMSCTHPACSTCG